jgi:hypothetical protein
MRFLIVEDNRKENEKKKLGSSVIFFFLSFFSDGHAQKHVRQVIQLFFYCFTEYIIQRAI